MENKISNKKILDHVNKQNKWCRYKKESPILAKKLYNDIVVETLEGNITCHADNFLCRGSFNDIWCQKAESLFQEYIPDVLTENDYDGWQKYLPKPDSIGVLAVAVDHDFEVYLRDWGILKGIAGSYLIKMYTDKENEYPDNIWIVQKKIFESTYRKYIK
ncbi:hypothetical protein GM418_27555 [Maribellus comscasis]|uniref:Uncharacterized protein n=1 Tax=Maribellus comscasis TaxID=2681766 RepID=A0A6I6JVU9_9BACT|nr:hypothetical protein [Maribellus comscasis]QGY47285.1 hypothetical protein GM418_27555 [Maribellus comscasis]